MSEISKECTGGAGVSGGIEYKFKIYGNQSTSILYITYVSGPEETHAIHMVRSSRDGWTKKSAATGNGVNFDYSSAAAFIVFTTIDWGSLVDFEVPILPIHVYWQSSSNNNSLKVLWFDGTTTRESSMTNHTTEETALEVTVVYIPPKE